VSEVLVRGRLTPLLRALGEAECYGGKSRAAHFMVARKQRESERDTEQGTKAKVYIQRYQ
jgi:hypothetical protein